MNCRLRVLFLVFFVLMLGGFVGHILPVQSQLSGGDILVIDPEAGTGGLGALFRVNPSTGARTLLSEFGDPVQGPTGVNPFGVAVESSGNILVIDENAGTGGLGALFRVNPSTGARTLLSDFGVGTPAGSTPRGVAVESSGNILVIDENAGTGGLGALFRVNPSTGARTLLSDFGNALQGQTGVVPAGVAVEYSGNILVIDPDAGTGTLGALFRVNPSTGARTLLSDFGVGTPAGVEPFGVAVYPVLPRPVGGYVESVNKVGILTPYLALAGLVIAVSAVVVFKKRSRD